MKAYFIGGGIGSLAGAAFMIRDGDVPGDAITIYEMRPRPGGCLDAGRLPDGAYSIRGGRMLTTEHYECTWELLASIPSISNPVMSIREETIEFNAHFPMHSKARLVDRNRHIVDVSTMGFTMRDRLQLLRLIRAAEERLGRSPVTDWLSPGFFQTNFWLICQTTFGFQPWHSAVEFRRRLHRFLNEFPRIGTLTGVRRTAWNQHDAIVRPLVQWLESEGVRFVGGTRVTDMGFANEEEDGKLRVTTLGLDDGNIVALWPEDLVFFQNGSMTDAASLGTMDAPPPRLDRTESQGWALWEKIAEGRPEFGNPAVFNRSIAESWWESFTVTCPDTAFFDAMRAFSGNEAGTGGLVTFTDSAWLLSVMLYHQPHFLNQPRDLQIFWGYGLYPDRVGDFVAKPMAECGGAEILDELCGHLNFDRALLDGATCIPCRMPYVTSMFMPRARGDRPAPVPANSRNLAFVSQFVEIRDDVVFTIEYSVRAAQMAVYELLDIDREIPPVTRHDRSIRVILESLEKAFA